MSFSGSADRGAQEETSPVHSHASFSQVSWPYSPGFGMTLNFHLKSPVFASYPTISPGTFSIRA